MRGEGSSKSDDPKWTPVRGVKVESPNGEKNMSEENHDCPTCEAKGMIPHGRVIHATPGTITRFKVGRRHRVTNPSGLVFRAKLGTCTKGHVILGKKDIKGEWRGAH